MFIDISRKVIVVTGASRGIGAEIVKALAKEEAKIVINYCNSEREGEELFQTLTSEGVSCIKVKADVTKREEVEKMCLKIIETFGKIDVLINNAGVLSDNKIQDMNDEQWNKVLDVNLTGTYLCSQIFSQYMMKQKYGKIINISSIKGQEGCANQVNYSASKAGVIGFTKALAKELGEYNISVNSICPGFVVTDLNIRDERKKKIAETRSTLTIEYAMEDLVSFIIFMISPCFKGTSGRNFNLDSRL